MIIAKNILKINFCEFRIGKDIKELFYLKKILLPFKI